MMLLRFASRQRSWNALALLLLCATSGAVSADEFRVETDLFLGSKAEPVLQTLTLFADSVVYDFHLSGGEQVTVYDLRQNRFIMLDVERRIKTTLTYKQVLDVCSRMKVVTTSQNPLFQFAADPKFEISTDQDELEVEMMSKVMSYRAMGTKPKSPDAVRAYQEFADWSSRLNAMTYGPLPPFARVKLNEQVAEQGWVPLEVERTIFPSSFLGRRNVARAKHMFNWVLSGTDRKRISRVGDYLATFEETEFTAYRQARLSQNDK